MVDFNKLNREREQMTTLADRLANLKGQRSAQASEGIPTPDLDTKIAELEGEQSRAQDNAQAAEEYDFAQDVQGAKEEDIKQRATSEGGFEEPTAPGTYLGEVTKIERELKAGAKHMQFKLSWHSTDPREPSARGILFAEMKDNAEWVLTRSLERMGIPYEVRGSVLMFNDFTKDGPWPCQAIWETATQGRAKTKITGFLSAGDPGGTQPTM